MATERQRCDVKAAMEIPCAKSCERLLADTRRRKIDDAEPFVSNSETRPVADRGVRICRRVHAGLRYASTERLRSAQSEPARRACVDACRDTVQPRRGRDRRLRTAARLISSTAPSSARRKPIRRLLDERPASNPIAGRFAKSLPGRRRHGRVQGRDADRPSWPGAMNPSRDGNSRHHTPPARSAGVFENPFDRHWRRRCHLPG